MSRREVSREHIPDRIGTIEREEVLLRGGIATEARAETKKDPFGGTSK